MSLFSLQPAFCSMCGVWFTTTFHEYGGIVCSKACNEELQWRKTLSIMGKQYYPQGSKEPDCKSPTPQTPR